MDAVQIAIEKIAIAVVPLLFLLFFSSLIFYFSPSCTAMAG
ncbi:hypothetical protein J2W35_004901 [Variovorax boronicumulans]|jgi:hypothetical protein|nr:hypothetical protein [Variovorax boronicumulans]MDQ0084532.1 hypothetical protein [Variovorax boronicumulans]